MKGLHFSPVKYVWGTVHYGKEEALGELTHVYVYPEDQCKEDWKRLFFQWCPGTRQMCAICFNYMRKHFFIFWMMKHWHRLPRVVEYLSLRRFINHQGIILGNLVWVALLEQRVSIRGTSEFPSSVNHSDILLDKQMSIGNVRYLLSRDPNLTWVCIQVAVSSGLQVTVKLFIYLTDFMLFYLNSI